jgi:hypothetical protein
MTYQEDTPARPLLGDGISKVGELEERLGALEETQEATAKKGGRGWGT